MSLYGPPLWALLEGTQKHICDGLAEVRTVVNKIYILELAQHKADLHPKQLKRARYGMRVESLLSRPKSVGNKLFDERKRNVVIRTAKFVSRKDIGLEARSNSVKKNLRKAQSLSLAIAGASETVFLRRELTIMQRVQE